MYDRTKFFEFQATRDEAQAAINDLNKRANDARYRQRDLTDLADRRAPGYIRREGAVLHWEGAARLDDGELLSMAADRDEADRWGQVPADLRALVEARENFRRLNARLEELNERHGPLLELVSRLESWVSDLEHTA